MLTCQKITLIEILHVNGFSQLLVCFLDAEGGGSTLQMFLNTIGRSLKTAS